MGRMEHEPCNISLALELGAAAADGGRRGRGQDPQVQFHVLFPGCGGEGQEGETPWEERGVGRRRMRSGEEEDTAEKDARDCNGSGGAKKKLRLTTEQSTLLESSFRERNTLTLSHKEELADRLSLRPRQVEVWFQNRRARTKVKKTEVDCEFLKKCCESLSDENRRLKKEIQDLRSIKPGPPFYVQLPKAAAALTMCPSCERIGAAVDGKLAPAAAAFEAVAVVKPWPW